MNKSALDAKRGNIFLLDPNEVTLVTDESHPLFDPRVNNPADEAMILNVMIYGVLEPILCRKNGEAVEVIAGRGRTKAAQEANRRLTAEGKTPLLIPAIIKKGSDADLYGILITENEIRREDSPMLKSQKATKLMNMGYSVQQIARTFGVARQTVDNWLGLQDLAEPLQNAVENNEISATAAVKLAKFDRVEQVERYDDLKKNHTGKWGRPAADEVFRASKSETNTPAPKLKNRREVEQELDDTIPSDDFAKGYRAALCWILGRQEDGD